MPKFIAHALTGATIIVALYPKADLNKKWTPLLCGAIIAVSPDFDYLGEWLLNSPDIHRGVTHSLVFSFATGLATCFWLRRKPARISIAYSCAFLSHTLLDMAASTEGGVKLMYPFSDNYYHLGLTALLELPLGNNLKEVFTWVSIETAVFLPVFIAALLIKKFID